MCVSGRAQRLFEALDDDGSGRVSSEEFKGVLQEMGVPVAGTSFTVLTDLAGVDTSGIVNYVSPNLAACYCTCRWVGDSHTTKYAERV